MSAVVTKLSTPETLMMLTGTQSSTEIGLRCLLVAAIERADRDAATRGRITDDVRARATALALYLADVRALDCAGHGIELGLTDDEVNDLVSGEWNPDAPRYCSQTCEQVHTDAGTD